MNFFFFFFLVLYKLQTFAQFQSVFFPLYPVFYFSEFLLLENDRSLPAVYFLLLIKLRPWCWWWSHGQTWACCCSKTRECWWCENTNHTCLCSILSFLSVCCLCFAPMYCWNQGQAVARAERVSVCRTTTTTAYLYQVSNINACCRYYF